jgi:lipid A 3-O-deacylase
LITRITLSLLAGILIVGLPLSGKSEEAVKSLDDRLWRFSFDNDALVWESDDFFTGGFSLYWFSAAVSGWDELQLTGISQWIANEVPGIVGDGSVRVRKGFGVSQMTQTPSDLSQTELIEDDVRYAGVLGIANSWMAVSDERLNAFQIYLGVVGPVALGDELQNGFHSVLGRGEDALGWDNQLNNEPLVNLNYSMMRKIGSVGTDGLGWAADLAYGGAASLGNLFTEAQFDVQARLGRRVPRGFAHIPDIAGRGVIMEPVFGSVPSAQTQFYLSATLRGAVTAYTVLLDGNTFENSDSVDYEPGLAQVILGGHLARGALGLHFTAYLSSNPVKNSAENSDLSWANISLDYRF